VAGIVELALQEAFKPAVVMSGWKKTCLDTLDPTPLVEALEKGRAELKKSQEERAAERERLQALLQEEKDPEKQDELKAAAVEAEVLEEHLDIPELPAAGRRRKTRYMPDGGILTSPAEEKRQLRADAEADKKKRKRPRAGRGRQRKAARRKRPAKKRARTQSAAEGKEQKVEGKRQQRVPERRPLRSKLMDLSADEAPAAAESSDDGESSSDASDEESSLTEQSDTEVAESDVALESEAEPEAVAAAVEEKADRGVDMVLGECMACEEPLLASDCIRQCSKCTGLLHSTCAGPGAPTSRSRQQEFRCAACRRKS
jgi:hypothetical protein